MKKQVKQLISVALVVLVVASAILYFVMNGKTISQKRVIINQKTFFLEVADTLQKQQTGLSYRESLPENTGMLFIYNEDRLWQFWMYEMRFPLDVLWITDNKVADITENIPEPAKTNNTPVYMAPKVPVRYILELNAGTVKKYNIQKGDTVTFKI